MDKKKIKIAHILNKFSETASAIDQLKYSMEYCDIDCVLIAGGNSGASEKQKLNQNFRIISRDIEFFSIVGVYWLYKTLKVEKIDVIHVHHARSGIIALICGVLLGVPTIVENGAERYNYSLPNRILFTLLEIMSARVVFVSNSVKTSRNLIERLFVSGKKISVIKYGIEKPKISTEKMDQIRKKQEISSSELIFMHTGRFVAVKNQLKIIELFKKINDIAPSKLFMIGDGPLMDELKGKVDELDLDQKVIFTGLLSRNEVYDHLAFCDYFIMLSKTEGHSVSLLEAMAIGCVPILSDIPSFRETISEKNAVFCSDEHVNAVDVLRRLNSIKRNDVITEYDKKYSKSEMMAQYIGLYQEIACPILFNNQ